MKCRFFLKILLLCLMSSVVSAQSFYFEKRFDIPVNDSLGNPIKEPWLGGLNAVIIGEIDLNFDGKLDLVVYDQHAERIFTFLNMGIGKNGLNDYRYAPEFVRYFPRIAPGLFNRIVWFQLVDFNGDGLPDLIMSNGLNGVRIYKNVSQKPNIQFELYIGTLMYRRPNGLPGLVRFSELSVPHFVDVDGDGDLDILIFRETSLHFYKNRSEGNNTFDLIFADDMWGCFEKSAFAYEIILNTCPDPSQMIVPLHGEGSTIFAFDFNNSGVLDLLLSDGGYPTVTALFNNGTPTHANIWHFDATFPRESTPVNLLNTPVVSAIDVNNDGVKELIFSPFNARDFSTESYASIWVYQNTSIGGDADFQLISRRFLQDEMLDFGMGSFPTIVDIDGDGLLDIVVGNYGTIDSAWLEFGVWETRFVADLVLLRNIGTAENPEFQVYPLNLTPPLNVVGAVPTFGDIDGDGHLDLLIGTECGKIMHYRNRHAIAENVFPPHFELVDANILEDVVWNNNTVGDPIHSHFTFLAPQLFDVNDDGLLDLIIGSQNTIWFNDEGRRHFKSSITYFENTGTTNSPVFTFVTDSLGRVDVINRDRSNDGFNKPHFFRDANGNMHLFCGNQDGKILHFTDIDRNLYGTFQRMDDIRFLLNGRVETLCEGSFTAVAVADLNNDGYLDLVVGNHRGGLTIFFGISGFPPSNINRPDVETRHALSLQIYPNPVTDFLLVQLDSDSRMQGKILDLQGRIVRFLPVVQNGQSIDVSALQAGVYILKIMVANQIFTEKFVKI